MVAGCTEVAWPNGLCKLWVSLSVAVSEEHYEMRARSMVQRCRHSTEPSSVRAVSWNHGWLVSHSLERLLIKINNSMLVWERALHQLFLLSYRCLFFKAMYSAKHTASIAEIATEEPSQLITRLQTKSHLFPEAEEGIQWKPDGSTLKIAVYLSSVPGVAQCEPCEQSASIE